MNKLSEIVRQWNFPISDELDDYLELSCLISEELFNLSESNSTVYYDLSEESIVNICSQLGINFSEFEPYLFEKIHKNLVLTIIDKSIIYFSLNSNDAHDYDDSQNANESIFYKFYLLDILWNNKRDNEPREYFINAALLLAFSLAASQMGQAGGFNPNAYYPRLSALLELDPKVELDNSYRSIAKYIWNSWNVWLNDEWNGILGIGTAYSVSHMRHVGLALSQALIRSVDRAKLPKLFRSHGFAPNTSLVERDLEVVIEEWVNREESWTDSGRRPSEVFKKLWASSGARDRILAIISKELESWDGSVTKNTNSNEEISEADFDIKLEYFEFNFPARKIQFSLGLNTPRENQNSIKFITDQNTHLEIAANKDISGMLRLEPFNLPFKDSELLTNVIEIEVDKNLKIKRNPRQLVVFRKDPLTKSYVETQRLEVGNQFSILYRGNEELLNVIRSVLESHARPGWKEFTYTDILGLPEAWQMFSNVELLQIPSMEAINNKEVLRPLIPLFSSSLNFLNGFQLPGTPAKWHTDSYIEILASLNNASSVKLQLIDLKSGDCIHEIEQSASILIWKLDLRDFQDGDYEVQLVDEENIVLASKILRLRSSDSVDRKTWSTKPRLAHNLEISHQAVLMASDLTDSHLMHVDGASINNLKDFNYVPKIKEIPRNFWWGNEPKTFKNETYKFAFKSADTASCFVRGSHIFEVPVAGPSKNRKNIARSKTAYVDMVCRSCGLIKKGAALASVAEKIKRDRLKTKKANPKIGLASSVPLDLSKYEAITETNRELNLALDAVMHVGGGGIGLLRNIASFFNASPLFAYDFINKLDQRGYIDIKFDDFYEPTQWEVTPTTIVETSNQEYFLSGFISKALWAKILKIVGSDKTKVLPKENSFPTFFLLKMDESEILLLSHELGINYSKNAGRNLLKGLPSLMTVAESLPKVPYMGFDEADSFNFNKNSWVETSDLLTPGAFRITSKFRRKYIIRTESDITDRTVRYTSPEFAKHYISALQGKALIAYSDSNGILFTPKGASLPGLYGRATTLLSGINYEISDDSKNFFYRQVTESFASHLNSLLVH